MNIILPVVFVASSIVAVAPLWYHNHVKGEEFIKEIEDMQYRDRRAYEDQQKNK